MRNLKFISVLLISILIFSGCSMSKSKKLDKATQQKNITKIQNDVSEIMGKDYKYVIKNMGDPYVTTYYINAKDYKDYKQLDFDDLLNRLNIEMIYPKEGYESSALYLDISKNKVVGVKSDEFIGVSSGFDNLLYSDKSDIIIDFYNRKNPINIDKLKNISLDIYKGHSMEELIENIGLEEPNAIAYGKNGNKMINYYILDSDKDKSKVAISITEENGKIINISQDSKSSIVNSLINLSN
jgi:hypothetical protein